MSILRFKHDGRTIIEGIGREFKKGDTIDLPDDIAKNLLKKQSRHFEEVFEKPAKTEIIKLKSKKFKKGG